MPTDRRCAIGAALVGWAGQKSLFCGNTVNIDVEVTHHPNGLHVFYQILTLTFPSSLTHTHSHCKSWIVIDIHNCMVVFWWWFARCDYKSSHVSIPIIVILWIKDDNDDKILSCTVKSLKEGHVVAVPTDTIYGLACLAQNSEAVRRIYDIKGRNQQKPLAICVGQIQDIYKWV